MWTARNMTDGLLAGASKNGDGVLIFATPEAAQKRIDADLYPSRWKIEPFPIAAPGLPVVGYRLQKKGGAYSLPYKTLAAANEVRLGTTNPHEWEIIKLLDGGSVADSATQTEKEGNR